MERGGYYSLKIGRQRMNRRTLRNGVVRHRYLLYEL